MNKFTTPSWLEDLLDSEVADIGRVKDVFAKALERLMDEEDITRKDLAGRLKVTQPYVTKLLRGDANLSIKTMVKAARAFDSEIDLKIVRKNVACTDKEWIDLKQTSDASSRPKVQVVVSPWTQMEEVA